MQSEPRPNPLADLDFITKEEVAAAFRVHPRTVERLVLAGRLRAVKVHRSIRFYRADVLAFLEENTIGSRPKEPS